MAVATVTPVVWGISTGHGEAAEWIALSADCICWVALKGTYAQRLRILLGGAMLTLASAALGSITGGLLWLSIACMLVVAFIAMLFKNLGERGSGLSLCLYVMFLIANAHPVAGKALQVRLQYVAIGGAWNFLLGLTTIVFLPTQQPYRRTIALIWRAGASLMNTIAKGWDGRNVRSTQRQVYLAEQAVRTAIDTSFAFHERAVHQLKAADTSAEARLAQVRKAAALVSTHMSAIAEELEDLRLQSVTEDLRLRIHTLLRSVQRAAERMASLSLTRRDEDALLMRDALDGMGKQLLLLQEYRGAAPLKHGATVRRVMQLCERSARLMSRAMELLAGVTETTVLRSYSAIKTLYVLHPRHWWRSIRILFNLDSHTARYAIRTSLAAGVAIAIYKWLRIDHGYWLPFTVIIIVQPYFVATIRKAADRLIGTLTGGLAGGLLLLLPSALHLKEVMLFATAIAMVYFFRVQYRVSAFFITLNLVLLLSVSQELNRNIILLRAGLTITGALIAVAAGFLLLPAWDKRWLPRYMAQALERNWAYFRQTFGAADDLANAPWTRYKRQAEVSNSNAFDSFNRAVHEPGGLQREYSRYYQLLTHNVRVTRELNNIHLEDESKEDSVPLAPSGTDDTTPVVRESAALFADALSKVERLSGKPLQAGVQAHFKAAARPLNAAQKLYLARLTGELHLLRETLDGLIAKGT